LARVHSAVALKFFVVPIFVALGVGAFTGRLWLVVASFVALLATLRLQRRQEAKR
jgi:hypothetical protein